MMRHSAQSSPDLGLIITPMLDMAFQLLAFFIMTYHPPAREAMLDGTLLPATQLGSPAKGKDDNVTQPDPAVRLGIHVIVRAVPAKKAKGEPLQPGQPREILLKRPKDAILLRIAELNKPGARPTDPPADLAAALKALAEELARSRGHPDEKDLPINIQADRSLRYGYFIAIQDVAKAAGFKSIGFTVPP
jgi:biopolymer transport protein ExbD